MFITSTYGANSAQKHLVELLGLQKSDLPAMYVLTPTEYGATKYKFNGPPANASEEQIKKFAEDFLDNKLTPFHKSAPIPKTQSNDHIEEVVGKNWNSAVRSGKEEVFVLMYRGDHTAHKEAVEAFHQLCEYTKAVEHFKCAQIDMEKNDVANE